MSAPSSRSRLRLQTLAIVSLTAAYFAAVPTSAGAQSCPGDCNANHVVAIDELIRGVRIALGELQLSACPAFDTGNNGSVSISELISAVNAALSGCPATQTPTITATQTITTTATVTFTSTQTATPTSTATVTQTSTATATATATATPTPTSPPADLEVVINPDPVRPGGVLSIEVIVSNPSPFDLLNVSIEADVPNDVDNFSALLAGTATCVGGATPVACEPGDRLTWTLGTVRAREAVVVSFAPRVKSGGAAPAQGTPIEMEATLLVAGQQGDHDVTSVLVDAMAPLELAVREDVDPVAPGADLTYTLAFGNRSSNVLAPGAVLRMPLPVGTTLVAASDGGMLDAGVVEWPLGTLAPGEGGTRQLTVQVGAGATMGTIISASADIADANTPANNTSAGTVTGVAAPGALQLAMEVNPDPANPGDGLAIQLTAANAGSAPLTDVVVELVLPEGLASFSPALNDGGTCPNSVSSPVFCEARERAVWQLGTLAPGAGITVTTQPLVADTTASGSVLVFDARAVEATGQHVAAARSVVVESGTVLELAVREDIDPVAPGAELTYTLAFGNRSSNVLAPGATLRMALPPGTMFVAASDGGGMLEPGVVEWPLGTLAPGEGGTRQLTVQVDEEATLGATLSASADIFDTNTPPNRSRAGTVTRLATPGTLRFAMEVNPDPANPGDGLAVQLTASNTGAVPLLDVTVEMIIPEGLASFSPALNDGGTCPNSVSSPVFCEARERAVWQLGTLAPGAGITVTTQPLVAATTASGSVLVFDAEAFETTGQHVAAARSVVVESGTVLELALREDVDPVAPDGDLTYTLAFGNRSSNVLAPGAVLRMPLPVGTLFVAASDGGTVDGRVVEWSLGTLAPGDGGTRQLTVRAEEEATLGATISASADIGDTNTPPNRTRAGAVTRVATPGTLRFAMEVNPDPANPGDGLAVQLTASNAGAVPLLDVTVEMIIPEGLASFSPALNDGGTCPNSVSSPVFCEARERAVWQLGTLAPGAGITVTTQPLVADTTASGSVLVFDTEAFEMTGQRVAAARSVVVESGTVLELAVREDVDPIAPGADLTYTLAFGNQSSNVMAPGATLRMALPPGTMFVAASDGGGMLEPGVVEWPLGTLAPGEGGTRQLTVQVEEEATLGATLSADADIFDTNTPPNRTRAVTVTRLATPGTLRFAMEVNPDPANPGDGLAVQLTASNTGAVPLLDVTVEMILPEGLASFSPLVNDGGTCPNSVSSPVFCEARERAVWQLGTLAPGAGITVTTQPLVADTTASGSVLVFDAEAFETTGQRVLAARSVVIESGTVLELALREDVDPVAPGGDLTYTLAFGNQSSNVMAATAALRLPVPPGTTFVAASDGGMLDEGVVEWAIGALAPGANGARQLMVEVEASAAPGDIVVAGAEITDANLPANRTRATTVTRLAPTGPLRLAMEVTPNPTNPGGSFEVDLTVTNMGGVPLFDVEVGLILPDGVGSFSPVVNNGGICPNSVSSPVFCEARERVVWQVGMLAGGAATTVTTVPPIPIDAAPGIIITFDGHATSGDGSLVNAQGVVRVGP